MFLVCALDAVSASLAQWLEMGEESASKKKRVATVQVSRYFVPNFLWGRPTRARPFVCGGCDMDFRRGHRDERRRRVLMDESETRREAAATEQPPGDVSPAPEPVRRYTAAVRSQSHSQLFDLIPTRGWTNLVWLGLLLSAVAAVEALYRALALHHARAVFAELSAVDLSQRGSMATWLSSAMLMTCAVYGLLTYHIRRHRADDYRGRYRMWCWVVPVFVWASIDQVAGLQESVRTALLQLSGIPDYPDAMPVWVGSAMLLTTVFSARLLIEMRSCRLAVTLILTAWATPGSRRLHAIGLDHRRARSLSYHGFFWVDAGRPGQLVDGRAAESTFGLSRSAR